MKDSFDIILKQLLSELPEHAPKPDVWRKIDENLDEELPMSQLRETLKNNEYSPKQSTWSNIEAELDKSFFFSRFFKISLSALLLLVGTPILFFLFNNNSGSHTAENCHRDGREVFWGRKAITVPDDAGNQNQFSDVNNYNISDNNTAFSKQNNGILKKASPFKMQTIIHGNTIISGNNMESIQLNMEKKESCISGKIEWEMIKNDYASLYVYDEGGKLITTVFENKKFDKGNPSYNFNVTSCLIEKNKKYLVRLKVRKVLKKELACRAK